MFLTKKIGEAGKYKKYILGNFVEIDQEKLAKNKLEVIQFIGVALKSFNLFFIKIDKRKEKEKYHLKKFGAFKEAGGITDSARLQRKGGDYLVYGALLEDSIKIMK